MTVQERRYGAYTSGANALRIGLFDDVDDDERPDDVDSRRPVRAYRRPAPRATPAPPATPVRASTRVPRPRRLPASRIAPAPARVAPASERAGRSKAPFLFFLVGLVVAGVAGVLVLNTKINENSFRLGALQQTREALSLQEQQLEQQLADLESPGNLRAAATRLGLVPAGTPAYISLPDGRVVGVPQPAAPDSSEP